MRVETIQKLRESKLGDKNPMFQKGNISDKASFSYLVGFWLGDGSKTTCSLQLAVPEEQITPLIKKMEKLIGKKVMWNYDKNSTELTFKNCAFITRNIKEEIHSKKVIKRYPYEFLCGMIDSDGWVQSERGKQSLNKLGIAKEFDKRAITILFGNTSIPILNLYSEVLEKINIPYRWYIGGDKVETERMILGIKARVNKENYWVQIITAAANYIMCAKLKNITICKTQVMKEYIKYYKEMHWKQKIPIVEKFVGLQGEGVGMGTPQYFIRVYGCNLRCVGCDTSYSYNRGKNTRKEISINKLVSDVRKQNIKTVCLTGGEIMLYRNKIQAIIAFLREHNIEVVAFSNGTKYDKAIFSLTNLMDIDIKSPSTKQKSDEKIISLLRRQDEVKTLIKDESDLEYARYINKQLQQIGCSHILQVYNILGEDNVTSLLERLKWLSEKVLNDKFEWSNVRILPQLHTLIWGNKRGV